MFQNISLKWKGIAIILLTLVGLTVQAYISVTHTRDVMLTEKKLKLSELIDMTLDTLDHFNTLAESGQMTLAEAQDHAKNLIRNIKYNAQNDYIFVFNLEGTVLAHAIKPELEGKNLIGASDENGVKFVEKIINLDAESGGYVFYHWERGGKLVPKLSYGKPFEPWGWAIGTGVYIDDIDAAFFTQLRNIAIIMIVILAIVVGFIFLIISNIIRPIRTLSDQMRAIANETFVTISGTTRKDEFGLIARTLDHLKQNIEKQRQTERKLAQAETQKREDQHHLINDIFRRFQEQIGTIISSVVQATTDMQQVSDTLHTTSQKTTTESQSVSGASESASLNVQTVASAAEQLSASIQELVINVSETAQATKTCSKSAETSQSHLQQLQKAVNEIGGVIQSINEVAEQTNLLAHKHFLSKGVIHISSIYEMNARTYKQNMQNMKIRTCSKKLAGA